MIEIRDLVENARRDPSDTNIETLWRAVFLLRAWYLIPAKPQEEESFPLVTLVGDEPWLMAFTNFRRLRDVERQIGRGGDSKMLMLDPDAALRQIIAVKQHIRGVIFNPNSDETFRCGVDELVLYAKHFGIEPDVDHE